jgi:hypothetical protein
MSGVLLKLLLLPPELLKMHAHGYADLASEEWERQICAWKTRWLIYAMSVVSCVIGVFLTGVSLLLWLALPVLNERSAWGLALVPFSICLLSLASWLWAKNIKVAPAFGKLKAQIELDVLALRQSRTP